MSDQEQPLEFLTELEARIEALRALAPIPVDRIATDSMYAAGVERHLQVAIQAAIDLASWVVSEHLWREPGSYRETFSVLADEGYLDRSVAYRLADMAGYRNVLVHVYTHTDPDTTVRLATEGLSDLVEFAQRCAEEIAGSGV